MEENEGITVIKLYDRTVAKLKLIAALRGNKTRPWLVAEEILNKYFNEIELFDVKE